MNIAVLLTLFGSLHVFVTEPAELTEVNHLALSLELVYHLRIAGNRVAVVKINIACNHSRKILSML